MKSLRLIFPLLKGYKKEAVLSLMFAFFSAGSRLSVPFLAGKAIDLMLQEGFEPTILVAYILLMVGLVLIGSLFRFFYEQVTMRLGEAVVYELRKKTYAHLMEAPIKSLDLLEKGKVVHTLNVDIENVKTGLVVGAVTIYDGAVSLLFTFAFMASVNYALALLVVVLTPLSLFVSRAISKGNAKYFKAQAQASSNLTGFMKEELTNSESIISLGAKEGRGEKFEAIADRQRESGYKAMLMASLINPATRVVNNVIYGTLVIAGAAMLLTGFDFGTAFTVGGLSSFLTYANNFMTPFNEIADVSSELSGAEASFKRVEALLALPLDVDEGKKELRGEIESLTFDHVDFGYTEGQTVIDDFDLEVYPRHKIALVGPTGCGKTTLINLLLRFYDPRKGKILINDIDTGEIEKKKLRQRVSAVLQDPWIFKGTVKENIAYGRPDASDEDIKKAADLAMASSFIMRLEKGFDTMIGGASSLSIGEKQLICLARAMLVSPDIVILDEATSNIDLHTESLLKKGFDAFMEGRTSVVVAHRLSTIVSSDLIVVMKKGHIVEMGKHKELMAKGGFYKELYEAQFA